MTILIELSPETEARLSAEAVVRGIAPEIYAESLLRDALSSAPAGTGILTPEDVDELTRVLTEGSEKLPVLPPEATERASFYEDRW